MARILVCRTCPRYERAPPPGEVTRGRALGHLLQSHTARGDTEVRAVNCLAGCRNPCNAAIDGPGKMRLRFSELTPEHLPLLFAVARLHDASVDGNLTDDELPDELLDHLSARSPARIGD